MNQETVVKILKEKNLTLSTAESCTGGMIGELITSVSGASEVFGFGFITYANEAKEKILGVKHETLEKFGAVSEETAREMALGTKKVAGSDISVSVTGIAGPKGGTKEKPVGLVYTAICYNDKVEVTKLLLKGDRESVRKQTCEKVFENIINCAQNL